jgi:hypothetical protein
MDAQVNPKRGPPITAFPHVSLTSIYREKRPKFVENCQNFPPFGWTTAKISNMRKTSTPTKTKAVARHSVARKNSHAAASSNRPASRANLRANGPNGNRSLSQAKVRRAMPATSDLDSSNDLLRTIPLTTEDRLAHIQALGQRVGSYVKFMCMVGRMEGSSAESKDRAVAVFYDRLYILEQELSRIHDGLLLG